MRLISHARAHCRLPRGPVCGDMGGMPGWSCHCNATATHIAPVRTQHAPVTGTSTYARKSWGGLPRCDLAPLTTSFGTVGQWERQHVAMAASRNWNHGTHFLWDPRAAPTFHPLSTPRHRAQCRTCQLPRSTLVLYSGRGSLAGLPAFPSGHEEDVLAVGLMDTRCFLVLYTAWWYNGEQHWWPC